MLPRAGAAQSRAQACVPQSRGVGLRCDIPLKCKRHKTYEVVTGENILHPRCPCVWLFLSVEREGGEDSSQCGREG